MRYRPFLSHKRQQANTVAYLKQQLCMRGGGGWKDTDDIPLGVDFVANCVASIEHATGGFIWWGTKDTLGSPIICQTELPTALERAKRDLTYPVVPVLVDLKPGRDNAAIEAAVGSAYAKQLLSSDGILHYADEHDACGYEEMHVDRDSGVSPLDADDVRSLAARAAKPPNDLHAAGTEKHLLLRCPANLAVAIGLASNGTGPTWVPFYDGHDYYVGGLTIG